MYQTMGSRADLENLAPRVRTGESPLSAHEKVARRAVLTPHALAARDEKTQLTFAEMEQHANRLARYIQMFHVGVETPVGLFFERSVDFVVAALAVLKAGGAYVPLDAAYPPARIDAILRDAGVPVLLSHRWMAAGLAGGPWKTIDLDFDAAAIANQSAQPLEVPVAGRDLAYIIYTSGSTGSPKGVEVTHANLQNLIGWYERAFRPNPTDRASQIMGLAFDAAVCEIWCNLTAGASLHLIDEVSRRSPSALKDWLVAEKITIGFVPTIMAEHLIITEWPDTTALRYMHTGGDTLHRHPNRALPFVLVNNYGPTECTVEVTSGIVPHEALTGRIPSIGRPIDGMEILILDSALNRVTPGGDGEICVAGPQLARGYRNLPELTAEKFVYEPGTARRIYRTGDRGRALADGQIAFLGRIDDQIKIRGFRVEPDEIVAHLKTYPQMLDCVVVVRGDSPDEKALIAYVCPTAEAELTASVLREHLRARVPDYMIPSTYVRLSFLPVTTTGKCDKQSLPVPAPDNLLPESFDTPVVNQTRPNKTESRVAELVSALMNGRPIDREDNFFLIGGHSMLAAQLLARIRENLAVTLNLRQLFDAPTIAALSALVDQRLGAR
jgi:amino acid adenylation domain-containing protein